MSIELFDEILKRTIIVLTFCILNAMMVIYVINNWYMKYQIKDNNWMPSYALLVIIIGGIWVTMPIISYAFSPPFIKNKPDGCN